MTFHQFVFAGHYKVEIFDKGQNQYLPTVAGLGMHVEVKDPDEKLVLARVRTLIRVSASALPRDVLLCTTACCCWSNCLLLLV